MYRYCSNNLLNIKDVFIKKLFMPIFMLKFSLKLSLHHRLVRVVAQSRKEFMTIGYRQSRIFLFATLSSENKSINRLYRRLFS